MSGEKLPEGWVEAPLSSVTTLIRGVTYKKEQAINYRKDDYFPIIRANNIQNGQFDITDLVFVPRNLVKESQKISPEDIVIAMSSGSKSVVGKSAHQRLPFTCSFGAFCGVLRPEKPIYPSFIAHFTKSSFYRNKISSLSAGANINNIKPASFDLVNIPIPSHVEQILIVKKLDMLLAQVDNTKGRLEKIPQILKRFRQAVLAAAVSGKLTDTWRVHNSFNFPLQKYYDLIKEKKLKAKNTSEPCEEKTWLRCNLGHIFNVKSGDGLTAKEMNTSGDIAVYGGNGITGYHDRYNTEEPSIVIGRVGYYCGSVHLTSKRSWITDNALLVDFHSGMIEKKFAYWLLKGTNLRVNISSSAQPVISGAKIYSIEIVIPPIEEQAEIVRRVEQLFAYADTIEKQVNSALDRVNNLTQSILAKAFRGELTAQWRAENPDLISGENSAAALLEKIKAERAASGSKKASRKKT